ncbi:hypothetical protein C8R45DRAFT_848602 [Mycena sanguinolenta]|nr:hypothetical protein C8R45DRAFT_848602 [Mycena sanguinolenta]
MFSGAPQLLQRGYFPCAPLEPTLAIELRVVEFVRRLFLNIPPNNTPSRRRWRASR